MDALTLYRSGYQVTLADASPAMLAQARTRLVSAGSAVRVVSGAWHDLPLVAPGPYDAVMVTGNALAGACGAAGRRAALEAFRSLLAEEGLLLVDTHDWEQLTARGDVTVADSVPVARDGATCVRVFRWEFSGQPFAGPADLEVMLVFHGGSSAWVETYPIRLWPFTKRTLHDDLAHAGLRVVWTDAGADPGKYSLLAAVGAAPWPTE